MTVLKKVESRIPTEVGEFRLCLFQDVTDEKEHLALVMGNVWRQQGIMVRVHSECFTGDVLGSLRCDCGEQLQRSMERISEAGVGIVLYLRQEGRGIGLLNKLRAYNLQDEGYDTVEANLLLGHQADERDYTVAAEILHDLGVGSIQLLTNNPEKITALEALGIQVTGRISLTPGVNPENARYLQTKVVRMNHLLNLNGLSNENGHGRG